jgi:hypothetical protein
MKTNISTKTIMALGTTALLLFSAANLQAQDRPPQGNFDPEQMRQRMVQRLRDQFEVQDDSEWKVISERITKVLDARRAVRVGGGPGGFGPPPFAPGGPPPGGADSTSLPAGAPPGDQGPPPGFGNAGGPPPGGPGGFRPEPNPALDALRKAIDSNAPAAELKAKIAEFKADLQQKKAALESAQESLRQVLSARQEAIAVLAGLL